jgi:hypothetical protein
MFMVYPDDPAVDEDRGKCGQSTRLYPVRAGGDATAHPGSGNAVSSEGLVDFDHVAATVVTTVLARPVGQLHLAAVGA